MDELHCYQPLQTASAESSAPAESSLRIPTYARRRAGVVNRFTQSQRYSRALQPRGASRKNKRILFNADVQWRATMFNAHARAHAVRIEAAVNITGSR
jgi:hypothetical protein